LRPCLRRERGAFHWQSGSELTQVQVESALQSVMLRMLPQVFGKVPSRRTQHGRCEKMNDELPGGAETGRGACCTSWQRERAALMSRDINHG
jgi:hypothetical protein